MNNDYQLLTKDQLIRLLCQQKEEIKKATAGQLTKAMLASYLHRGVESLDDIRRNDSSFPLPAKVGKKLIWPRSDIDRWLDNQRR